MSLSCIKLHIVIAEPSASQQPDLQESRSSWCTPEPGSTAWSCSCAGWPVGRRDPAAIQALRAPFGGNLMLFQEYLLCSGTCEGALLGGAAGAAVVPRCLPEHTGHPALPCTNAPSAQVCFFCDFYSCCLSLQSEGRGGTSSPDILKEKARSGGIRGLLQVTTCSRLLCANSASPTQDESVDPQKQPR